MKIKFVGERGREKERIENKCDVDKVGKTFGLNSRK